MKPCARDAEFGRRNRRLVGWKKATERGRKRPSQKRNLQRRIAGRVRKKTRSLEEQESSSAVFCPTRKACPGTSVALHFLSCDTESFLLVLRRRCRAPSSTSRHKDTSLSGPAYIRSVIPAVQGRELTVTLLLGRLSFNASYTTRRGRPECLLLISKSEEGVNEGGNVIFSVRAGKESLFRHATGRGLTSCLFFFSALQSLSVL